MWIRVTLLLASLWQWVEGKGGGGRSAIWQHLDSTARTHCLFPGKHLIRLLTALASVRVCVYVRESVQTGGAAALTYLILVNSQGWWRVCSCRPRYLLQRETTVRSHLCVCVCVCVCACGRERVCLCATMCECAWSMIWKDQDPSLLMITQTLKMVFNIQSTHGPLSVDKSSSNLIYIPITDWIPLTNHTQITMPHWAKTPKLFRKRNHVVFFICLNMCSFFPPHCPFLLYQHVTGALTYLQPRHMCMHCMWMNSSTKSIFASHPASKHIRVYMYCVYRRPPTFCISVTPTSFFCCEFMIVAPLRRVNIEAVNIWNRYASRGIRSRLDSVFYLYTN